MKIKVKLFATLCKERFDEKELETDSVINIDDLLNKINLKRDDVAIIFINGRHGDYSTILNDSDIIGLFPPIGGG